MKNRSLQFHALAIFAGYAMALCVNAATAEVVAVVSAKSNVVALTRNQVADIFLGKTSRFPDGTPAVPIDQVESSAARDEFYQRFAGKSPAQLNAHWSKIIFTGRGQPPREFASAAEVKKYLATNPNAIGYVELGQVDASVKVLSAP